MLFLSLIIGGSQQIGGDLNIHNLKDVLKVQVCWTVIKERKRTLLLFLNLSFWANFYHTAGLSQTDDDR